MDAQDATSIVLYYTIISHYLIYDVYMRCRTYTLHAIRDVMLNKKTKKKLGPNPQGRQMCTTPLHRRREC